MELALLILRKYWLEIVSVIAGMLIGWTSAWKMQNIHISLIKHDLTKVEADFEQYKARQVAIAAEAKRVADLQRKETEDAFKKVKERLDTEIASGESYRRCVAAGRCGGLSVKPACAVPTLQTPGLTHGAGTDAVPPATRVAEEVPPVIGDCARTTLLLNQLQNDIERQAGYETVQ